MGRPRVKTGNNPVDQLLSFAVDCNDRSHTLAYYSGTADGSGDATVGSADFTPSLQSVTAIIGIFSGNTTTPSTPAATHDGSDVTVKIGNDEDFGLSVLGVRTV